MSHKKRKLRLNTYRVVDEAIRTGLLHAFNRLEDAGWKRPDYAEAGLEAALNEVMVALEEVVRFDD